MEAARASGKATSKKYGVSEVEICLRRCLEREVYVVSTSWKEERLRGYLRVASLSWRRKRWGGWGRWGRRRGLGGGLGISLRLMIGLEIRLGLRRG